MKLTNWIDKIPAKKHFHFRTKDMKTIIESNWWDIMHLEMGINHCDYPNRYNGRNCTYIKELDCEDCRVFKLGLYKREIEVEREIEEEILNLNKEISDRKNSIKKLKHKLKRLKS